MRIRVCAHENVYWVEEKVLWSWHKLPSISFYLEHPSIRYLLTRTVFYDSYEKARDVASEYLRRLGKNIGVTQEITR